MQRAFAIEVQRFHFDAPRSTPEMCGFYEVEGIMNILFDSVKRAVKYINTHVVVPIVHATEDTPFTGVDVISRRRYVVREYRGERMSIPPFDFGDMPKMNIDITLGNGVFNLTFNKRFYRDGLYVVRE